MDPLVGIPGYIAELAAASGNNPELLLQHLLLVRQHYNPVPPTAVEQLAERLTVPAAQVRAVIDFYAFMHPAPRGDSRDAHSWSSADYPGGARP